MKKKLLKDKNLKKFLLVLHVVVIVLLIVISSKQARAILFIFGFIVANVFVTYYKKYFRAPVEIEVLSFGIILCSYTFGLTAGLIVAILGGIVYIVFTNSFNPFVIPMMIGYVIMAVLSSVFTSFNIVFLGIAVNIIHNLFVFTVYHFFYGYDPFPNFLFSVSNILFNVILFYNLGQLFFSIMG